MSAPHQRLVFDAPTRLFHATFALCFIGAYLSSESERYIKIHAALGYSMVALLVFRLLYGFFGPRSVRWSSLGNKLKNGWMQWRSLCSPWDVLEPQCKLAQHFPLLLATNGLLVLSMPMLWSGHVIYGNSGKLMEAVHELTANAMLLLVFMHLSLLLLLSALRGSNLALPIWRGRVAGSGPDLITHPRLGLAIALLLFSAGFGVWAVL